MDSNHPRGLADLTHRLRLAVSRKATVCLGFLEPPTPQVLVVSPGGVASTSVMEQIARFCETNSPGDGDGLKHIIRPPRKAKKMVLITGEPREVASSLRRRGYLGIHSAKMGSVLGVMLRGNLQEHYFRWLVRRQRENFAQDKRKCLVLQYGEVFESCKKIADFLNLPSEEFCRDYPARRARRAQI